MKLTNLTMAVILGLAAMATAPAAVLVNAPDTPIILNLNDWAGTLPADFSLEGPSNSTTYRGTSPTSTTGGVYAPAGQGFAYRPSSQANTLSLTGTWQNTTGVTLESITFSYNAFVVTPSTRDPGWTVSTSLNGDVSPLSWLSSEGAQTKSVTLTGLSIAPGETFTFTFASDRGTGSGSSPLIGLNNLTITASAVPEPGTIALLGLGAGLGLFLMRRRSATVRA